MGMFKVIRVSGSFLSLDWKDDYVVRKAVEDLERNGAQFVHFDVMDGKFVKEKTYDHNLVKYVQENTNLMLDVHLMVDHPERVIKDYISAGADILTIHYESTDLKSLEETLKYIKSKTILAGVAINPETPAYKIRDLIKKDLVDVVLVMGVNPGAGGQEFIPGSAEKVAEVREMSKSIYIEIDGGVNAKNSKMLRMLGANILVSGSYLFNAKNMKKAIKTLKGKDYASRIRNFFTRKEK